MKKLILPTICLMVLAIGALTAQQTETRELESFTKVKLEGNIEIHLAKGNKPSIRIETKKERDLQDFLVEVRNDELFLSYEKEQNKTPKFIVYLKHTGVSNLHLSGLTTIFSEDVLDNSNLTIEGSGITKGKIKVAVKNLRIDADGITNLAISGIADDAIFNIDGIGKINAKKLQTKSVQEHSDGFAKVKLGSRP